MGRDPNSPESLILGLSPHTVPIQTYAERLLSRMRGVKKHFNCIKANIKRCQGEQCGQSAGDLQVDVGMRVYVGPPPPYQPKDLSPRFTRRCDGPFVVTAHVHGSQDLLKLCHETTGKDKRIVNTEIIILFRKVIHIRFVLRINSRTKRWTSLMQVSPDLAKVAFAFGHYLSHLPKPQAYVSEACKAAYQTLPAARDIVTRCVKLKGLVLKYP